MLCGCVCSSLEYVRYYFLQRYSNFLKCPLPKNKCTMHDARCTIIRVLGEQPVLRVWFIRCGGSRPGTCRVPMGGGGFTMPKAWPYKRIAAFILLSHTYLGARPVLRSRFFRYPYTGDKGQNRGRAGPAYSPQKQSPHPARPEPGRAPWRVGAGLLFAVGNEKGGVSSRHTALE